MPEHDKKSKKLDDAVEKTFPASDPVTLAPPTGIVRHPWMRS
jgi:hypothetical protein